MVADHARSPSAHADTASEYRSRGGDGGDSFLSQMSAMDMDFDDEDEDADEGEAMGAAASAQSSPEVLPVEDVEGLMALETDACILCHEATDATSERHFGLAAMVQPTTMLRYVGKMI